MSCFFKSVGKVFHFFAGLQSQKAFAALLVAGIIAMLAGFVSKKVVHTESLAEDAFSVAVTDASPAQADTKPQGPEPILALLAGGDITKGEKLSKACAACHSFNKGGPNRVGPNLWGIIGMNKGSHDGFSYSAGLAAKSGEAWNYQSLNRFIWKPKAYISDTKMSYIGMKKPEDRAAIIAWLRTLNDSPVPLPGADEIAAETSE